jgi:hypothetical protein
LLHYFTLEFEISAPGVSSVHLSLCETSLTNACPPVSASCSMTCAVEARTCKFTSRWSQHCMPATFDLCREQPLLPTLAKFSGTTDPLLDVFIHLQQLLLIPASCSIQTGSSVYNRSYEYAELCRTSLWASGFRNYCPASVMLPSNWHVYLHDPGWQPVWHYSCRG